MDQTRQVVEFVKAVIAAVLATPEVKVLLGQIALNVVVAVAASVNSKTFQLSKLGDFLLHKVLPYSAIFFVAKLAGDAAGMSWIAPATWAVLSATLLGDLADNLVALGIKLPDGLLAFVVKR